MPGPGRVAAALALGSIRPRAHVAAEVDGPGSFVGLAAEREMPSLDFVDFLSIGVSSLINHEALLPVLREAVISGRDDAAVLVQIARHTF